MKRTLFLTLLTVALGVVLTGCGQSLSEKAGEKMMEKAIESGTGGNVDVDADNGSMTIKSEDGQTQISTGGDAKIPDGFPKELIKADDAKIIIATTMDSGYSVSFTTGTEQGTIYEKYKADLLADGWKKNLEMDAGTAKMLNFTKDKQTASITVGDNSDTEQGGQTMVNIVLVNESNSTE